VHPPWPACEGGRRHRECQPVVAFGPARNDGQARLTLEIYLARHGETEWTLNGRHTGNTDLPLTRHGEEEAAALGARLAGLKFDVVYSSPLQRAKRTAEIAGFPSPHLTPLLREVDYGDYEGITTKEIHASRPDWELYKDGCPGGETRAQIYKRALDFIALAASGDGRVLAFAHGHILRAVAVAWMSIDIAAAARLLLDVATLSVLRHDEHGHVLAVWNAP
jgi:broad specificity phosphatase PhoE